MVKVDRMEVRKLGRCAVEEAWLRTGLAAGLFLTTSGLLLLIGYPQLFRFILQQELALRPGSKSYDMWKETPVPMYIEFYFFNWTNPDKLNEEKPAFQEMGPYRFIEKQAKVNVTWNENGTVSFRKVRRWYFDPDHSVGSLEDNVTTLNAVAMTAAFTVREWSYLMQKSLSMGISQIKQKVAITRTVAELLFDGYRDPLLDIARKMPPSISGMTVPFDKFGWFYKRNGSDEFDGLFNMETGEDDLRVFGRLRHWNNEPRTTFFEGHCGMINGSAGEFWPPDRTPDTPLTMYSPDLCRSIKFGFMDATEVNGVEGLRYAMDETVLDNGTVLEENRCFCHGDCSPSGVINVTACHYGAPAFVSYPHFYLADPYYTSNVQGMNPDGGKHRFYITIEPTVGIPLDVAGRLQINILLQPIDYVSLYQDVPTIYFPMFWFNQRATVTKEIADSLKGLLEVRKGMRSAALWALAIGLLLLLLLALGNLFAKATRKGRHKSQFHKKNVTLHLDGKDKLDIKSNEPLVISHSESLENQRKTDL